MQPLGTGARPPARTSHTKGAHRRLEAGIDPLDSPCLVNQFAVVSPSGVILFWQPTFTCAISTMKNEETQSQEDARTELFTQMQNTTTVPGDDCEKENQVAETTADWFVWQNLKRDLIKPEDI